MADGSETSAPWRSVAWAGLLSALLTGSLYALSADIGLDLTDEGAHWYGVIQTASGEVPGRDFEAYDPGRYYWGAAWSLLFGTGILALRLSTALFQGLGLFCGLLVARRFAGSPFSLLPIGAVLAVWMFPRHKLFEPSLSMMAVFLAVRLLEGPSTRRYFVSGLFVGLAAFFGRNHGLYCAVGFLLVILLLHWKQHEGTLPSKLFVWSGGILLGYSPMLLMLAFVPGFASRFVGSLLRLAERGANLPLPIPWPWTVPYDSLPPPRLAAELVVGGFYLLLVIAYPLGLVWSWFTRPELLRRHAVFVAAVCIGLPDAHHAWVRADALHLAQSIHPLLLALFALPYALGPPRRILPTLAVWGVLGLATIAVAWGVHPQLRNFGASADAKWAPFSVGGDRLRLPTAQARGLARVQAVVEDRVGADEPMFIAPFRVGYYPLLGKVSPVFDLYLVWPATDEHQQRMIRTFEEKRVDWALITLEYLSEDPDTAFARTHPKVAEYLLRDFESIPDPGLPRGHRLFRRRAELPARAGPASARPGARR